MAVSKGADADGGMPFQLLNDDEMVTFTDSADSDNTKKQIKYSVSIFDGYCEQAGVDFHLLDNTELTSFEVLCWCPKQKRAAIQQEINAVYSSQCCQS